MLTQAPASAGRLLPSDACDCSQRTRIGEAPAPRFIRYQRLDLWLGIALVVVGAVAMMSFTAATFADAPQFGRFSDAAAVATGMEARFGRLPGVLFAIALIDASIIGALAMSLSSAYAIGDVLAVSEWGMTFGLPISNPGDDVNLVIPVEAYKE